MSGLTLACMVVALAVMLKVDRALVPWALVQIVRCLWPLHSSLATVVEEWAWATWAAERATERFAPDPVQILAVGEVPADLERPFIVPGLLNASGSTLLGGFDWLMRPPVGDLQAGPPLQRGPACRTKPV